MAPQTLSSATSVREIVAREPDASGLLPYLEDRLALPPPADVAERIWSLLVQDITPHTARAREQQIRARYGEVPYSWFQQMLVVAKTCQIDDFCLADLRQATPARWVAQIKQVDAFLVSRAETWEILGARFAEIRKLELEELALLDEKDEALRRAAPLREQRAAQQQARAKALTARGELERKIQHLGVDYTGLELEYGETSRNIDRMRSDLADAKEELAQLHRQMGELRPVVARGAHTLASDLAAVEERREAVRESLSQIHARGEAYAFTLDALKALKEDLQRLCDAKMQCRTVSDKEKAADSRLIPLRLRLTELRTEHDSLVKQTQESESEKAKAEAAKQEARRTVEKLTQRLAETAQQLDALENQDKSTMKQLEQDINAASKQLQILEAVIRSREQWLDDFHTAEAACNRLENELAVLRGWALSQAT